MAYKQPESLFECASHILGIIIGKAALDIIENCTQTEHISVEERRDLELLITRTAEYFDTLIPKSLHNIATQESLKYLAPKFERQLRNIKNEFNFLDIVLRSHTIDFDVEEWPYEMFDALCKSLHRLKNLQNLKLSEYLSHQNLMCVTGAIRNMGKLESFELYECKEELLKVVCDNCPLKKLIAPYSYVTDVLVPSILKLENLVELNIYYSHITEKSCVKLLLGLPNLTVVYCNYLNSYLTQINNDSVKLPIQATRYYCFTRQDIMNLTKYCPLITKLYLVIQNCSPDLSSLAVLKHLKKLYISSDSLQYDHVKRLLELKGDQLTELGLHGLYISERTVNEIKLLCCNTGRLTLNSLVY